MFKWSPASWYGVHCGDRDTARPYHRVVEGYCSLHFPLCARYWDLFLDDPLPKGEVWAHQESPRVHGHWWISSVCRCGHHAALHRSEDQIWERWIQVQQYAEGIFLNLPSWRLKRFVQWHLGHSTEGCPLLRTLLHVLHPAEAALTNC